MSIIDFPLTPTGFRPDGTGPSLQVVLGARAPAGAGAKQLGEQIIALAGRVASAQCRWLLLVAEFDALDGASDYGLPTTTRWISHHCGIAARTARGHLKVARTLAAYPTLAESMAAGRISYSHARIIAATAGAEEPNLVADLLNLAEHGTVHQLEDIAMGLRSVDRQLDDPTRPTTATVKESLSRTWDRDARRHLTARLDSEHGALLDAAMAAVQAVAPDGERLTATEALVRMAEITLATLADSPTPPRLPRGDERAALVLHLHATRTPDPPEPGQESGSREPFPSGTDPAIHDPEIPDHPDPGPENGSREPHPERSRATDPPDRGSRNGSREPFASRTGRPLPLARLQDGPGIPGHVLQRLTCACRIRVVVHDPENPANVLDLGRSQRLVSDQQYRALSIRDNGRCRHPGCESTWYLEAHHVKHWIDGGPTDLDNLILICGAHHDAHHRGEFTITRLGNQQFRFLRDGVPLLEHVDPSTLFDTDTPIEDEHDHVTDDAAGNRWDGYRMKLSYAVGCLAVPRHRARDASRKQQAS